MWPKDLLIPHAVGAEEEATAAASHKGAVEIAAGAAVGIAAARLRDHLIFLLKGISGYLISGHPSFRLIPREL